MYKSMDTTPPFSAKEGILFPNLLTFVHGIEVLFYIALSCTNLLVRLVYFMWPYPTLIFTKNWILFDIIEYTCEAKNRRYNEIHYVPLSQYMSWKGQLRHIICVFELPFTLLISLLRQCGFVEFSGKIRLSNSSCKVHIGFILNQRKVFLLFGPIL